MTADLSGQQPHDRLIPDLYETFIERLQERFLHMLREFLSALPRRRLRIPFRERLIAPLRAVMQDRLIPPLEQGRFHIAQYAVPAALHQRQQRMLLPDIVTSRPTGLTRSGQRTEIRRHIAVPAGCRPLAQRREIHELLERLLVIGIDVPMGEFIHEIIDAELPPPLFRGIDEPLVYRLDTVLIDIEQVDVFINAVNLMQHAFEAVFLIRQPVARHVVNNDLVGIAVAVPGQYAGLQAQITPLLRIESALIAPREPRAPQRIAQHMVRAPVPVIELHILGVRIFIQTADFVLIKVVGEHHAQLRVGALDDRHRLIRQQLHAIDLTEIFAPLPRLETPLELLPAIVEDTAGLRQTDDAALDLATADGPQVLELILRRHALDHRAQPQPLGHINERAYDDLRAAVIVQQEPRREAQRIHPVFLDIAQDGIRSTEILDPDVIASRMQPGETVQHLHIVRIEHALCELDIQILRRHCELGRRAMHHHEHIRCGKIAPRYLHRDRHRRPTRPHEAAIAAAHLMQHERIQLVHDMLPLERRDVAFGSQQAAILTAPAGHRLEIRNLPRQNPHDRLIIHLDAILAQGFFQIKCLLAELPRLHAQRRLCYLLSIIVSHIFCSIQCLSLQQSLLSALGKQQTLPCI